jgi:hypothetical protein
VTVIGAGLLLAEDEAVDAGIHRLLDELVAGRLRPCREVLGGPRSVARTSRSWPDARPLIAWAVFTIGIGQERPLASTTWAICSVVIVPFLSADGPCRPLRWLR